METREMLVCFNLVSHKEVREQQLVRDKGRRRKRLTFETAKPREIRFLDVSVFKTGHGMQLEHRR